MTEGRQQADKYEANEKSFYFTNFPDPWKAWHFWDIFSPYGEVSDVFLPTRRNSLGKKFGFVRFSNCIDVERILFYLNQIWIGSFKIRVFLAKRREGSSPPPVGQRKVIRTDVKLMHEQEDGNKAEVEGSFMGQEPSNQQMESQPHGGSYLSAFLHGRDRSNRGIDAKSGLNLMNKGKQEKEACIEKKISNKPACLIFSSDKSDLEKLQRSAVGFLRFPDTINGIDSQLLSDGLSSKVSVSIMGGNMVLITFSSKEELLLALDHDREWLQTWFTEINPWKPSDVCQTRLIWLNLLEIPLHAWNNNFFFTVGSLWGEVMSLDTVTVEKKCFVSGRILILTKRNMHIPDELEVSIDEELFTIKILTESFSFCPSRDGCRTRCASLCLFHKDGSSPLVADSFSNSCPNHHLEDSNLNVVSNEYFQIPKEDNRCAKDCDATPKSNSQEAVLSSFNSEAVEPSISNVKDTLETPIMHGDVHDQGIRSAFETNNFVSCENQLGDSVAEFKVMDELPADGELDPIARESEPILGSNGLAGSEGDPSCAYVQEIHSQTGKLRGQNTRELEEIEEDIEEDWFDNLLVKYNKRSKKGNKRSNRNHKSCNSKLHREKVANESLSDGDFLNRNSLLMKEAQETLKVGKLLGISFDCDDKVILEKLKDMMEDE